MKKFTLIAVILMMSNLLSAQWIQQNPNFPNPDPNKWLSDIIFVDQNHGWCVSDDYASQLGTTNGGELWEGMFLFNQYNLNSVFFTDQLHGWAVGDEGKIYHTNDGGLELLSWNEQESGTFMELTSIFFSDSLTGWVIGHFFGGPSSKGSTIRKTLDGGVTWFEQYYDNTLEFVYDIFFVDELNGWAVGNKNLYTNDGGENWITINDPVLDYISSSVYFIDSQNGWMTGTIFNGGYHGIIYNTEDGGITWEQQTDEISGGLYDIAFVDNLIGWAVGGIGTILYTSDGGQNWEYQESGTTAGLSSVCFVDENHGWISGDSAIILHTDNGGIVGISEASISKSKLNIYPNPTNEITTITFELKQKENITLSILNSSGQEVKKISLADKEKGKIDLDCSNFSPGIYFVNLQSDKGILTEKLIIE